MKVRFPLSAKIFGVFFLNLLVLGAVGWFVLRERFAFSMLATRTAGDHVAEVAREIVAQLQTVPGTQWDAELAKFSQQHKVDFLLASNEGGMIAGKFTPLPPEVHSRVIGATGPRPRTREDGPPEDRPPRGQGRPPRPFRGDGPPNDGPPSYRENGGPAGPEGRSGPGRPGGPGGPGGPEDEDFFPPFRDENRRPPRGPDGPGAYRDDGPPRENARDLPDKILIQSHKPDRYWVLKRITIKQGTIDRPMTLLTVSDSPTGHGLYFDSTPLLWAGVGVIVLSVLVWFPLVRGITSSVGKMRTATNRLAEGQFDARVAATRRDELGELGAEINRMAGRLAGYVDGQRRFLGDVAHELCAPVARLQMAVGIMEQSAKTPDEQERLADVREEVQHMAGLVNELLQFTRASVGGKTIEVEDSLLKPIAEKAVRREAMEENQVRLDLDASLAVRVAPDLLQRALSNLIRNAIRYAGHAGEITVSALREGEQIFVSVTDRGPGVPPEALPKLFDPFYRVDTVRTPGVPGGGGTGLGLAIVKTCVEACQGAVSVRNVAPTGFEVTLRLPAATLA